VFRDLLRRFVSVCEAIAYAHSRNVIHRDLKPSNVMLGEFGETMILDWGLAKRIDDDVEIDDAAVAGNSQAGMSPITIDGQVVGTPLYMAPEQATGALGQHGPATDIYALGAILYQLLTGKPAHGGATNEEILTRLRESMRVPAPSSVKRDVDKALEAICLKAMSPRPEDRYASATALAKDVENWAADEPVEAYREPLAARVARLSRRHQSIVRGVAAVIFVLIVGIIATSLQSIRARRAERNAQDRFNDVRTLAQRFMFDFHDKIQSLAGSTPAVKMLVETSLAYLDKLSAQAGDDRALLYDVAEAYEKVGDIQGNPMSGAHVGKTGDAIESYRRALAIRQRLAAAVPNDLKSLRGLMSVHGKLGDVQQAASDTTAALASYRTSLGFAERVAAMRPGERQAMQDVSLSLGRVARLLSLTGDRAGAMETESRAMTITRKLAEEDPSDVSAQRTLSAFLNRYAQLHTADGDVTGALDSQTESVAIAQRLADASPHDAQLQRELSLSLMAMGELRAQSHDFANALEQYERALAITDRLARLDPTNAKAQKDLILTHGRIGGLHFTSGATPKALEHFRTSLAVAQRQAAADRNNAEAQRDLAVAHGMLGMTLTWSGLAGSLEEALENLQRSVDICRRLHQADPSDVVAQHDLAASYDRIGEVYAALAHTKQNDSDKLAMWRQAHASCAEALELLERMIRDGSLEPAELPAVERLKKRVARYERTMNQVESPASHPAD
jgi:non-specific serine/threonine protein kinase/serine/threonine-protein kinase